MNCTLRPFFISNYATSAICRQFAYSNNLSNLYFLGCSYESSTNPYMYDRFNALFGMSCELISLVRFIHASAINLVMTFPGTRLLLVGRLKPCLLAYHSHATGFHCTHKRTNTTQIDYIYTLFQFLVNFCFPLYPSVHYYRSKCMQ